MTYEESIMRTGSEWSSMDCSERLSALQAIEDRMALESERFACPVESREMRSVGNGISLGCFDPSSGRIYINSSQLEPGSKYGDDPKMLITACLHEGRHSYQHQSVNGAVIHSDREECERWKENFDNYITFKENPRAYYEQPVEADAREFAEMRYDLIDEERRQLTEEHTEENELGMGF